MHKPLKIAYLSSETPINKRVWSGTHYNIYKSLQSLGSVEIMGPPEPFWPVFFGKIRHKLSLWFTGKRYNYRHSPALSRAYAAYFSKTLQSLQPHIIVAPAASCEMASLKTNIPIIYITDGTFHSCLNYHKSLTNLGQKSLQEGECIEQMAIDKSAAVIVSSPWAAESVKKHYQKPANQVYTLPFGANFDLLPEENDLHFKPFKTFNLLFVGVYWESKGGPIAYSAFKHLFHKGYDVSLTVVGCEPDLPEENLPIRIIKFIDKNSTEGQKHLSDIYRQHHLLLLPTRFDCTPIVINEASAFGLPSLVSNSGGVEGHLKNHVNGELIDYSDTGELFAKTIENYLLHPDVYHNLRKSSRDLYLRTLNWDHWTREFAKVLKPLSNGKP